MNNMGPRTLPWDTPIGASSWTWEIVTNFYLLKTFGNIAAEPLQYQTTNPEAE